MRDKPGLYVVGASEAKRIAEEYERSGWVVIYLPAGIATKDQLYDVIRSNCPLDPPLHSNRSWDALADSLWSGLGEVGNERIVIFWPNSDRMRAVDPDTFAVATAVLRDLCISLADPKITVSRTKTLLVFQVQG
ncbi:barstar family protein [Burkholderia cepacia]|uniref:barstar family protein n=1 Tax=Burkholderia cepacia TaxID=292 RepID=UPI001CF24EB5|nr:barstar family protein [Burkholderia cepacia]MCA7993372.1 barstar family protein [Burkholderia cepacia]